MEFPGFIGGAYRSQSVAADAEALVNWYVERTESTGAVSPEVLYPTPGALLRADSSQVPGRAAFSQAAEHGRAFFLLGGRLIEILEDNTLLDRGAVATNGEPGQIITNGRGGDQLLVVSGGNAYVYNLTTNIIAIIPNLVGKATQCGYSFGYGLVFDRPSSTVFVSDLFDFQVFDPLNFFQRNIGADDWIAMQATTWGQVGLFGTQSRDSYYFTGVFPIPFAPAVSGIRTEGVVATFAVGESADHLVWLGTTRQGGFRVYAASGYDAERISDLPLEGELTDLATAAGLSEAYIESYDDRGHPFLLLTIPGQVTWAYDFGTRVWHKRSTRRPNGTDGPWRLNFHCFAFGRHLWTDSNSGKIHETDARFAYDVDGLVIQRERIGPTILGDQLEELDFGTFTLLVRTGIGNTNPPYDYPVFTLACSDDGGQTWGPGVPAQIGREGDRDLRVKWDVGGTGSRRTHRLRCADAVIGLVVAKCWCEVYNSEGRELPLGQRRAA